MAEGKNINIRIAATGGGQAAAEFKKAGEAMEQIEPAADDAAVGVDDLTAKIDAMRLRTEALKQETEDFAQEQDKSTTQLKLGRAAMVGVGIGGAIVSKTFGEIAKGIESIDIEKLRKMDSAMADQVETMKLAVEWFNDPVGAAQRAISGSTIAEAFADTNEQFARNAQMQAEAIDRMIAKGRTTAEDLKAIARDIAAANAIIAAKDAADAKERDAADAAKIRGGAVPEDVRKERAAYDRDKEIEAINRGLEPKAATTQTLFDNARQAVINEERLKQDPRATREDVAKAIKSAEDASKAADEAKKEYDTAVAIAAEQRRGVRAEYTREVGDAEGDKATRLRTEAERERKKKEAADRLAAQDAARERVKTLDGDLDTRAIGAGNRLRELGVQGGNSTAASIGRSLQDGTDDQELKKLMADVIAAEQGGKTNNTAMMKDFLTELLAFRESQAKELEILRQQLKNKK